MTATLNAVACPKCGGETWDNRASKRNPKAPDYRCKDKDNCDGAVWATPRNGRAPAQKPQAPATAYVGDLPGDPGAVDFAMLCKRYGECVGYVVTKIVPALDEKGMSWDSASIASMSATLFIARNQRNV